MITHHIKQSLRSIKNNKMFSILNIGGFSVGFAVCMVLALFAYKEYNVDKEFPAHSNIYRVIDVKKNSSNIDFDVAKELKGRYPEIKSAVPLNYVNFSGNQVYLKKMTGEDYILTQEMISTTNDFFKAFSVKIIAGNPDRPFADLNSVVLSHSIALKLFGRSDVLGEQVNLGNIFEVTVSAVSEDLPTNSSFNADVFFNGDNEKFRFSRSCNNGVCCNPVDIYVLLNDQTNVVQLENLINADIPVNKSRLESVRFQPLTDIYLTTGIEGSNNKAGSLGMIRIFLSIAVLIMLLSVINYVNFSLSKQLATLKEIGIKITNGAGTKHLRAYYFYDVSISVIISYILALGITWLLIPFAGQLLGNTLEFAWLFSTVLIAVFLLILSMAILISSFAPVYIISRFDVQRLFGKKDMVMGKQVGKKILTVFQLTTAIALLTGLMMIQKQLHFVKSADMGFDKERLVRIDFGKKFKGQVALKQQINQLPFVQNCSFSNGAPGSIFTKMTSDLHEKENFDLDCINVDEQFLKTFGIHLIKGREFLATDQELSCYINETAFKRFGWENLENRRFNNGREGGYKIVGVVNDFNVASLHNEMTPVGLIYSNQYTSLSVKLSIGDLNEQMNGLKKIWNEVAPDTPMMYAFYDDFFDSFYRKEGQQGEAIATFSIITFIITCLGLMGQIFQTCNSRIKEIGIRKVNGARISEILTMLNRDFVKWVAIAFVIATPIAYYAMHKWLENFAYKTELNWWIFALSGVLALGIALLTVSWQSWRAATRNPVEALRYE